MRVPWLAFPALLIVVGAPSLSSAATIHVPDGQPTIQAGIDAASPGDTVLVACGMYYEHDIEMKSGVYLTSETGQADCVTVNAQQQGRVFYCNGVDDLASLVGFTITGGFVDSLGIETNKGGGMYCYNSSPTLRYCLFSGNRAATSSSYGQGGGMCCTDSSSLTLTDCTFSGNEADWQGGGMYCTDYSSPTLADCTFSANQVIGNLGDGAGMYSSYNTSPTLTGCAFVGNETTDSGYSSGGGLYCQYSSATLTNCTFSGNKAGGSGGGMYCWRGDVQITDCTFSDNRTTGTTGRGGGIYCYNSDATITGCAFLGNEAPTRGGGMCCNDASPTLTDCVFSGNRAIGSTARGGAIDCFWNSFPVFFGCTLARNGSTHLGGVLHCWDSIPTLTNCIIAFNESPQFVVHCFSEDVQNSTPVFVCCNLYGNANGDWVGCIADQSGIDGNFSEDPLFCGMYNDDFTLCANSPCLPDGNDCGVLVGAHGEGCPDCSTPVELRSWGALKAKYR